MSTILCIDDDPNILILQKEILETHGYTVFVASDGPTGIKLASENAVDLVILDFRMPGMDGGQVAETLFKEQPDLPVLMCTAYLGALPEPLRWLAAGCLDKGEVELLLSAVRDLIAKKKVGAQAAAA